MTTQTTTLSHPVARRSAPGPVVGYLRMLVDAYREAIEMQRAAHQRWPHMES
jgi:hypothetical protein